MIAQLDSANRRHASTPGVPLDGVLPLARAGFALHWLKPRSKAPLNEGWSQAPVASEDILRKSYRAGLNVGVRLGEPSRVAGGYLHAIDIDIRVPELADEAWQAVRDVLGVDPDTLPSVVSGSGGESRHLYFVTDRPFYSRKLAVSGEKIRRFDKARGKDVWGNTWEVELFGTNKQVAFVGSIHPDTGSPYVWERPFDLDLLDLGVAPTISGARLAEITDPVLENYEFEAVEPLTYKPGQLEAELDEVDVSNLDYDQWIVLGSALHHQFGGSEEGWDLWLKHTRRSVKYDGDDRTMRIKWRSFGRNRRRPVTMASVRQWVLDARREAFVDAFDDLPDLDDTTVDDLLGGDSPAPDPLDADPDDPLDRPVKLEWPSLLDINAETGAIRPHLHNVTLMVRHDPRTAGIPEFNQFTQTIVQRRAIGVKPERRATAPKPVAQLRPEAWTVRDPRNGTLWNDTRDNDIRRVFEAPITQGGYGIKITDRDLTAAIDSVAQENAFHPVREYLQELTWDRKPRADRLFVEYLGADDNAYTREIARLMLIAAVTRVFEPGHKFDFAVIIEGIQGRGKSSFIQALGKHWFAELDGDFRDMKQMIELMAGAWIIEIPELSSFNRSDVRTIKAFISRQEDRARLAYARRVTESPRQCVFVGSTNDSQYLKDDSGGRRFWPVKGSLATINLASLSANIDQIWAEALHLYRQMRIAQPSGTLPLYLRDEESREIALQSQQSRTVESSEAIMAAEISAWLETPYQPDPMDDAPARLRDVTCVKEIWIECLKADPSELRQNGKSQLVGRAMELVQGWERTGKQHKFAKYGTQREFRRMFVRKNCDVAAVS